MAQNIYDDPAFLAGYVTLDRQVRGLDGAPEWPVLRSMLPDDLAGLRVADLGCGFGWFSRWADEHGADSVLGVDVSTEMLKRARADTASAAIEYQLVDLDQLSLPRGSVDLTFSSLTFHYVEDISRLFSTVAHATVPGGRIVFSVEHPILSAPSSQHLETSADGRRIWPLENYLVEGERVTTWFVDGVIKQHRSVATYLNTLVAAGFTIDRIDEWGPSAGQIRERPELADELHRPWFLLVAGSRRDDAPSAAGA
ncbi:class I SAM-dependent methyltransferase [Ilumatobacter nonamiensis]|uniref:class I SAM-dependent methyltransferase n=1 Tax=Ilumatobacter nonamiensis TaxID=467093 RepID=UPI00034B7399